MGSGYSSGQTGEERSRVPGLPLSGLSQPGVGASLPTGSTELSMHVACDHAEGRQTTKDQTQLLLGRSLGGNRSNKVCDALFLRKG